MGWIGQKGGPKVEEEKNVATAELFRADRLSGAGKKTGRFLSAPDPQTGSAPPAVRGFQVMVLHQGGNCL